MTTMSRLRGGSMEVIAIADGEDRPVWMCPRILVSGDFLLRPPYPFAVDIPRVDPAEVPDFDVLAGIRIEWKPMKRIWYLTGKPHGGPMFFFEAIWPD